MTLDSEGRQFTFNGDNKQTQVKDVNNAVIGTYSYDGGGKRIKKTTATENTVFVYDGTGKLLEEYSGSTLQTSYRYAGSQLLATETATDTNYTATDQLGSPRVITNQNGQVISRRDFLPFGEEIFADGSIRTTANKYSLTGQDAVRQRFTGYQRDLETGLDFAEARYYNNSQGRFTAVDPLLASGKSAIPQTFNRYVYVMNNPMILSDPMGLQAGKTSPREGYSGPMYVDPTGNHFSSTKSSEYPNRVKDNAYATMGGKIYLVSENGYKEINSPSAQMQNLPPEIIDRMEREASAMGSAVSNAARSVLPDYCKVQGSIPMLASGELALTQDYHLFAGGGMTRGPGEFADFLKQARNFNFLNGARNVGFRIGLSGSCGWFTSRGMSPQERDDAAGGTNISGAAPLAPILPISLGFSQNIPGSGSVLDAPRAIEIGTPTNAGVSITGSEKIFDLDEWMRERERQLQTTNNFRQN